jgi:hypothetical protein
VLSNTYVRIAIVVAMMAAFGAYSRWMYSLGVAAERRAVVENSLDRNAQRNEDDAEIRDLDLDGLCREYGATRWLPDEQRCD